MIVKLQCLRRFVSSSKRLRVAGRAGVPQQDGVGGAGGARGELRPGAGHRLQDRQQARAAPPAPAAVRRPAQTGNTSHLTCYWGSDIDVYMYIDIRNICCLLPLSYSRFYKRVLKQCI